MSRFIKTDKAKIIDDVPEKIALDLDSDDSEDQNDMLDEMKADANEAAEEEVDED